MKKTKKHTQFLFLIGILFVIPIFNDFPGTIIQI